MKEPLLMNLVNNVYLEGAKLVMIDRRRIPREIVPVIADNYEDVARAIEDMVVQGAGDIAITAGFGLYLAALELEATEGVLNIEKMENAAARLRVTRPTGYHLAALLDRIMERLKEGDRPVSEEILKFLNSVLARQREISQDTGRHGETLLESGDTILTHCFAGSGLLYMLQYAKENGKDIKVICTETRPYLQGARLTAWSVSQLGLDTTLITDNMAAHFMSRGVINKVFTAADRIAMDGTVANKVGTLQLAISAKYYNIPFYILGYGGPDRRTLKGDDIPIEERDPKEVLEFRGIPISGSDVHAFYPAFDLTPADLITGVITRTGVDLRKNTG
ncbi:MAG: s-methyl-5-thioribose-1-phosphate isomerase [Deltaproteobacteria bacterium]|nr:s-methyl-5-thioribose-1-phosphate isomerase [Deltaproteobacteria bacterium]